MQYNQSLNETYPCLIQPLLASSWLETHSVTLSKGFAECNTRQTAHGVHSDGKNLFTECFLSALGKDVAEC